MNDFTKTKNILIVEVDDEIRKTLEHYFTLNGFKVFLAINGKNAFKLTLKEKIDVIITDIKMPEMDGIDLLKVIKSCVDHIPLVWFICGEKEFDESSLISLGAEGVIHTPINLDSAVEKITSSLSLK